MELKDKVVAEIKKIYDPEIPVNIFELGLIYDISIKDKKSIDKLLTDLIKKRVNNININEEIWTPLKKN